MSICKGWKCGVGITAADEEWVEKVRTAVLGDTRDVEWPPLCKKCLERGIREADKLIAEM